MLENFNDLIADLNQRGSLGWITEKKDYLVNLNQRGRTPAEIKQDVLKSDRLKHVIQSICIENKGITADAVRQKAKQILDDMGHTFNVNSTKCFGFVLMKYMKKMYKHVYYTKDLKSKLETVYARHPILFIPNHCSYVDFLLISVICHMSNVESPAIASGDNLSGIGIVSKLLRNGGAFFIRRAFGSDKLYWAVFDEYVQQQIANQDRPIEFFIEGTRSRTLKQYPPKQGMLSACVECILNGQVDDIYAVPISITYEKLLEETIYANELLGAKKVKESFPNLVKNLHTITHQSYGTIIVNFLKPMSIKELVYRKEFDLQQPRLTLLPSYNFQLENDELEAISAMAQTISETISSGKIIMPISIICTLLLQSRKNNEAISMQALVDDFKFLQNLLASLDVPMSSSCMPDEDIDKSVFETFKLHSNLFDWTWTDHKQHGAQNSIEPMCLNDYLLLNKKLIFVRFRSDTGPRDVLKNASSYLRVCSYRNQLINHCIGYSVFIVSLLSTKTSLVALDLFSFFLELFNLEFVFSRFDTIKYFKTIAIYFESVNIIDNEFHVAANSSNSRLVQFLVHLIKPYLFNYFNIYKLIVEKRFDKFNSEKTFCLGLQASLIEHIRSNAHDMDISYELLSLNLIENSIRSLGGSFGVLSKVKVKDDQEAITKSPFLYELNLQRLQDLFVARLASVCDTFEQSHSEPFNATFQPVRSRLTSPSESAFEAYYLTKDLTIVDTG